VAIRRAKQKQQVIEKLSQQAPPGEVFITTVHAETGPSPWLNLLFERVPGLVFVVVLMRKMYFLTLTNTSVVINSASRWSNRPAEVVAVFPRHAFPASNVKRARVWSKIYVQFPNSGKPTRLNIHGYWNREFDQLLAILPPAAFSSGELHPKAVAAQQAQGQYPGQLPPQGQYPAQGQLPPQGQYPQPPFPGQQPPASQVPQAPTKNPYQS
jgi:hypothetical protein